MKSLQTLEKEATPFKLGLSYLVNNLNIDVDIATDGVVFVLMYTRLAMKTVRLRGQQISR